MNFTRRKFLKAKGAVLTLPFLPSLARGDDAATAGGLLGDPSKPSKKLVIMYVPNGLVRRCFFPGEEEAELPGFVGGFNADKSKD